MDGRNGTNGSMRIEFSPQIPALGVLAATTTFTNGVFIIVMLKWGRVHETAHKLLIILATTDLLQGIVGMPVYIAHILLQDNTAVSIASNFSGFTLVSMSIWVTSVISMEQYIAILHPFLYQRRMSSRKFIGMVLMMWILILSYNIAKIGLGISEERQYMIIDCAYCLLSMMTILFCQRRILNTVNRIEKNQPQTAKRVRQNKSAQMCLAIVVSLAVCNLPYIAYNVATLCCVKQDAGITQWTGVFGYLNNLCDGLIYFWRLSWMRNDAKKVLSSLSSTVSQS